MVDEELIDGQQMEDELQLCQLANFGREEERRSSKQGANARRWQAREAGGRHLETGMRRAE